MKRRLSRPAAVFCAALTFAAALLAGDPHPAAGQQMLRGIVLDETGAPAAGVPLALHRIGEGGGALVDDATSDAAGRFQIRVAAEAAGDIYFVTARYNDELYIGPTFRPPFPEDADYVVQVGVESASAAAMLGEGSGVIVGPPPSPWRWALFGLFAVALLIATVLLVRRAVGPTPRRRLLIRIARLDEAYAGAAAGDPPDEYVEERERLLDRLRTAD